MRRDAWRWFSALLFIAAALFLPGKAKASCWEKAGNDYGIDPLLLKAIAWKESRGWSGAIGPRLKDGNRALGLMQVNTIHLPSLARFGVRREHLFDPCTSQKVGAWVLSDCIQRFGATWKAVGCYYAGPASTNVVAQVAYVRDVKRFYEGYRRQALELASKAPAPAAGFKGN